MSTIADYSVFTKAFLASGMTDFSQLYGNKFQGENDDGTLRAFAVIPFDLGTPLTPREAMNFDWSKLQNPDLQNACMPQRVSCRDADGHFIGNIVRVQPGERNGSIRLVAKVAVPDFVSSEDGSNPADAPYNTFVLVRTDALTNIDLPIAVATISEGYNLHKHKVVVSEGTVNNPSSDNFADPLDDVENANYVSFTINHLNGYTSVDFNPDAYATYDVTDALSRRVDVLEGKEGIEGLHLAFNSNTGDIILSDSEGHVIDQANLHLDLNTDTIIAEGEEGYKYVKTDINQDIHSAKAFMDPPGEDGSYTSAFRSSEAVPYNTVNASLVRYAQSLSEVCNGIRVRWNDLGQTPRDEIFYVFLKDGDGNGGTVAGNKYLAWNSFQLSDSQLTQGDPKLFHTASGTPIGVTDDSAIYSGNPDFSKIDPVYNHDVFVHTVGNSSLGDWDKCFQLMGFHDGDDIPLGTDLPALMQALTDRNGYLDPEAWIHGENADNAKKVVKQREYAKDEMVAYNKRRPALAQDPSNGTIIDSSGLDVRNGRITLGCGRVGEEGEFQKVNYGIQMRERFGVGEDHNTYDSLDFTISHHIGKVQFDENGHAAQLNDNGGLEPLTSSTLLSIEAGSYISGAPTCLILAEVTYNSESEPVMFAPVRMTAGFSVAQSYGENGLTLTIHDYRDNITAILNPDGHNETAPSIIEVQAIYTHHDARNETVPAQQMHTYIGEWDYNQTPTCSFLCNKIEEWMTAVGLADTSPDERVKLYVVIRVY